MAGKYRVVHTFPNPISTQQNITVPGFGVVAGATFRWVLATTDGVSRDDYGMGMGAVSFAGSTKQWACSSFSEDAADPSKCSSMGTSVAAIQMSNDTGTGPALTGVVSQISDGIRITWDIIPPTAWRLEVTLYGGDTMQCEAGSGLDASVVDVPFRRHFSDMPVAPEVVLFASPHTNSFSPTPTVDAFFSMGMGNDILQQACYGYADEDGRAGANRHGMQLENTRVISIPNWAAAGAPLVSLELTLMGVDGVPRGFFETTKRTTGIATNLGWFAFSTGGVQSSLIDVVLLDTNAAGAKNYTTPAMNPMLAIIMSSNLMVLGGQNANLAGGGFTVSSIDDKNLAEGCYGGGSQEIDPSNTFSRFDSTLIEQRGNGDINTFTLSFDEFTGDGFDFTVGNTSGNDKYHIILTLEAEPWGGIYWENLCTEFHHARTAQEILDSKVWVLDYETSTEGQTQEGAGGDREIIPSDNEQELARLVHEFELNIYAENWAGSWHVLSQIKEWVL